MTIVEFLVYMFTQSGDWGIIMLTYAENVYIEEE